MDAKVLVLLIPLFICGTFGQQNDTETDTVKAKIKPIISFFQKPFSGWRTCCAKGVMWINLQGSGSSYGYVPGVQRPKFTRNPLSRSCSTGALFRASFQRLRRGCSGCVYEPECGRRMLQVDLYLGTSKSGWVFNVGDSSTNNGYGGDSGTQQNDAELQGLYPSMTLYESDKCKKAKRHFANAIGFGVSQVRLYISNEYIRIQNNKGADFRICKSCLFALNWQSDSEGPRNYNVYFGLNRVVRYITRRGHGVCSAKVQWACPCCEN